MIVELCESNIASRYNFPKTAATLSRALQLMIGHARR
jgi:hypothetical protein